MQALPAGGCMVAVNAAEGDVRPLLVDGADIAAVNGPTSVVLSGGEDAVLPLADRLREQGHRVKRLNVSHAFHSSLMDPMLHEFRGIAEGLDYQKPVVPIVSNDGLVAPDADYWVGHLRAPVRFQDMVTAMHDDGVTTFLEVGPGGVLTAMVQDCLASDTKHVAAVPTLRKDQDEPVSVVAGLGGLDARGVPVDWPALFEGSDPQRVRLPTYAFAHQHYWLEGATVVRQQEAVQEAVTEQTLAESLGGLSDEQQTRQLTDTVIDIAAAALGHDDAAEIEDETGFFDVGFSSLTAVEVRNQLAQISGLELPPMLLFDYPTPAMVADYLRGELVSH
jgi:acyl transferase domain-containing protein